MGLVTPGHKLVRTRCLDTEDTGGNHHTDKNQLLAPTLYGDTRPCLTLPWPRVRQCSHQHVETETIGHLSDLEVPLK